MCSPFSVSISKISDKSALLIKLMIFSEILSSRPNIFYTSFDKIIFEEFAKTDNYGLIFTYMWAFDCKDDWDYVEHIKDIFKPYNTEFYYVELVAPQDVRLSRNVSENRLNNKPSKMDIEWSNKRLIEDDRNHRLVSFDGEISFNNYIKIDNSNISAKETAKLIKKRFDL